MLHLHVYDFADIQILAQRMNCNLDLFHRQKELHATSLKGFCTLAAYEAITRLGHASLLTTYSPRAKQADRRIAKGLLSWPMRRLTPSHR